MMKSWSVIRTSFDHVHCWDSIPTTHPKQFLKYLHRHLFYVTCHIEIFHVDNGREVEYLLAKEMLDDMIQQSKDIWPENSSCESMAEIVLNYLVELYGSTRAYRVELSEDGENGALLEWAPKEPMSLMEAFS